VLNYFSCNVGIFNFQVGYCKVSKKTLLEYDFCMDDIPASYIGYLSNHEFLRQNVISAHFVDLDVLIHRFHLA